MISIYAGILKIFIVFQSRINVYNKVCYRGRISMDQIIGKSLNGKMYILLNCFVGMVVV